MPQLMEIPKNSDAGKEEENRKERNEKKKPEEEKGRKDDTQTNNTGGAGEDTGKESNQEECGCKGPGGEYGCEAMATKDGHCDMCLLGCVPDGNKQSEEGYRHCTCAMEECKGCVCGCMCANCMRRKRKHAGANRDFKQGGDGERYAGI